MFCPATGGCKSDEFSCNSGYGCLDKSLVCDQMPLCLDNSDEEGCGIMLTG